MIGIVVRVMPRLLKLYEHVSALAQFWRETESPKLTAGLFGRRMVQCAISLSPGLVSPRNTHSDEEIGSVTCKLVE